MYNAAVSHMPAAESQNGVEIGRRKSDARKLFEESLQKVTRSRTDVGGGSSELMQLLLTNSRPARASDSGSEALIGSPTGAPVYTVDDIGVDTKRNAISSLSCSGTSTDAHEVLDLLVSGGSGDGTSVFTSDKLDEYLANDGMHDGPFSAEEIQVGSDGVDSTDVGVKDVVVDLNSSTDISPENVSVSPSLSLREYETVQNAGSAMIASDDAEVDIIDGFSFYSFSTPEALLQHVSDSRRQPWKTGVDAPAVGRTKKFRHAVSGKCLTKTMKGWDRGACADAVDALLGDGMLRQLSDEATLGLDFASADDDGAMSAADGGWAGGFASMRRYSRRSIHQTGEEARQPRLGRIYGRQFNGRFASKAKYYKRHIKWRRYPTSPFSDVGASTSADSETTWQTGGSTEYSQSPNGRPKIYSNTVASCSGQIHLIRLTESTSRRAIVALQLAPSMTNSPVKCSRPSMLVVLTAFLFHSVF